jgi:hypothetical protein
LNRPILKIIGFPHNRARTMKSDWGENFMSWNLKSASVATVFAVLTFTSTAALADKGCKNIQSKCAIEIGGRCDPVTGHWEYGRNGAGGTTMAYNACISRAAGKKK